MQTTKPFKNSRQLYDPDLQQKAKMKKVLSLTSKAIISTSIKEKNEILEEVMNLWMPQIEALETLLTKNQIKNDELSAIRKNLTDAQKQKESLAQNTDFYHRADQVRARTSEEKLISSIRESEAMITQHDSLSYPQELSKLTSMKIGSDKKLFTLMDLNLKRLEEAAYSYKKRLLIVEQSQESTDVVLRDYGSINDLISKVKELEDENRNLKDTEKSYVHDALTRRRQFSTLTGRSSREFVSIYRSFIDTDKSILDRYSSNGFDIPQIENPQINFDKVCRDPQFDIAPDHFEVNEFGNTVEPEILEPVVHSNDPQDQINGFKKIIDSSSTIIDKLQDEIKSMRSHINVVPKNSVSSPNRISRLNEANDELFARISRVSALLETNIKEIQKEEEKLAKVTQEKKNYSIIYADMLGKYKGLLDTHTLLLKRRAINKENLTVLYSLVSSMGNYLLTKNSDPMEEMIKAKFNVSIDKLKEEARIQSEQLAALEKEREKLQQEAAQAETMSATDFALRMTQIGKRPRRSQRNKEIEKDGQIISQSTSRLTLASIDEKPLFKGPKYFYQRPKIELIHGLAYASELASFVIAKDKPYAKTFTTFFNNFFSEIISETKERFDKFGKPWINQISQINFCSNAILVKGKENISIQTDTIPHVDAETETVEIPTPQKGRLNSGKKH